MTESERHEPLAKRAFYGRRAGKGLPRRQVALMENVLPALSVDIEKEAPADLRDLFNERIDQIFLEIGFGGGEHLVHRSLENPHIGFIGVEPFRNGMAKALLAIDEAKATNIRLFYEEARPLLNWLPEASIDAVFLLYPDPWPKKRHHKRRFISKENLDLLSGALKENGSFLYASDIPSYVEWTLEHCKLHSAFELLDHRNTPDHGFWINWPGTRYEKKALKAGRTPNYLTFQRK